MWYREARWQRRLLAEKALMRERFPGFSLHRSRRGELAWEGTLEPLPGARFRLRLVYPSHYPYQEPSLWVVKPELHPGTPHRYVGGSLCVHRTGWNPATGTAASMIPLAGDWLLHYVHWVTAGRWSRP